MTRTPALLLTCGLLLITACGGATATTTTAETTTTSTATSTSQAPVTTTTTLEPGPADAQSAIAWFVSLLNGEAITADEYTARFGDEFRSQVPFETAFQSVLQQFRPGAPYRIVESSGPGTSAETIIEASDGTRLRVVAEIDENGVITTLFIQPTEQPELDDPPESVEAAFTRLSEIGDLRAITAEVVDGTCVPINTVSPDQPAPLGSVFKLYVLAALGEAISNGDVAWEDELTVRDELKSIPTGTLQNRPDGDVVSIGDAATLMISISDNTAADHLIDLLGRENVESAQNDYGNTMPELNTPFLNTREFAALKIGPGSGLRDPQWIEGDEPTRRALLDQLADISPDDLPVAEWVEPIDPDLVEWFATPSDLCTLAARIVDLAGVVPEIADILAVNPGVPGPGGVWDNIWFKGGSEPGLVAAWWVTSVDGRVFLTAGSVVDADAPIDTTEAILLLAAARDLLAP